MIRALSLIAIFAALSGCATMSSFGKNQAYVNDAVIIAVGVAEGQGVPAATINRIAVLALAADSGTGATLSTIASLVNAKIASLHLPPGDLAAISVFEAALSAAITAKIGTNATVAATQAAVADVLKDVIAATS